MTAMLLEGIYVRPANGCLYSFDADRAALVKHGNVPEPDIGPCSVGYGWEDAVEPFTEHVPRTEPLADDEIYAEVERRASLFVGIRDPGYAATYREVAEMFRTRRFVPIRTR